MKETDTRTIDNDKPTAEISDVISFRNVMSTATRWFRNLDGGTTALIAPIYFGLGVLCNIVIAGELPTPLSPEWIWYITVLFLASVFIFSLVKLFAAREEVREVSEGIALNVDMTVEKIESEIKALTQSITRTSWAENNQDHGAMLEKMIELLGEEDTTGVEIFTIFNKLLPEEDDLYDEYYNLIEEKLKSADSDFRYNRAVIFRREALGYHLAARVPFWEHMKRVEKLSRRRSLMVPGRFWFFGASERLFDVAFGLFYSGAGSELKVKSLVIEFGRWTREGTMQALGLLELRGSSTTTLAFQKIFRDLLQRRSPSNISDLEKHYLRFTRRHAMEFEVILRKEMVTRLGYVDCFSEALESDSLEVEFAGGGFIVRRRGVTPRHLHIVPHGGSSLVLERPDNKQRIDLNETVLNVDLWDGTIAKAILDSCDPSVATLTNFFVSQMKANIEPWASAAIAFFQIPRVFVDANRTQEGPRVPNADMGHFSVLRPDLSMKIDSLSSGADSENVTEPELKLLEGLASRWISRVEKWINRVDLVFHHHTYDRIGKQFVGHDKAPFELRPPMQLFSTVNDRPIVDGVLISQLHERFLPSKLANFLNAELLAQEQDALIGLNFPLEIPRMPFVDVRDAVNHIIYELRSDLLVGQPNIAFWQKMLSEVVSWTVGQAQK